MGLTPEQQTTVRFVEIVTGWTVVEGPPPPDSPLARLLALCEEKDGDVTEAEVHEALGYPPLPE